ncbi:hypothetical protein TARUN_5535 [Trichoderma arundinaceum]|uniref:Suppressor srp40 n=1 Tax=Trichoderma arundinaceum TaxID=490622 RepID=A0A395NKX2_TRIAR|nr:hypothetical protein TARUN_5535 [Trichoderma arundinaceum]
MGDTGDFVRLHITPLDAELVKVVIPASVLPVARNISYHTLETFPERRYGFVELPEADAEKLRRKLNGTTLKGCKMRIEKARPETRIEPTGEEDEIPEKKSKSSKDGKEKSKKRKREPDVLEGVALLDRKVKRGWTETPTTNKRKTRKDKENKDKEKEKEKEKKKRLKSKYTEGEECLLKTKLPPNTMKNLAPEELEQKKRSKKKGSSRQVVIHEFEKTTKFPSFLKASTATDRKAASEFVKGKGWVDEEGNVVEEVKEKEKAKAPPRPKKVSKPRPVSEEPEDDDSTSSSGTSSEGTSSEDEKSEKESEDESEAETEEEVEAESKEETGKVPLVAVSKAEDEEKNDTSSDDSSESETSDEEEDQSPKAAEQATPTSSSKASGSKSTPGSTKPLAIKIPPPETPSNTKVHPLEALYKRPKPDNENPTSARKEAEPFSFFGAGEEEQDEPSEATPGSLAPMTPFTRQDYEWRNIRSAAPTPDTAHPSRMQRFFGASPEKDVDMEDDVPDEQQEDEEEGEDEDEGSPAPGKHSATSDFQKWFWENRRDLNRSWMTRRKTAAKEKRHRENKARASKAV